MYVLLFLRPKEVLLNVKMGVPGERCYYPPEELVWDASRDSSPRCLRTCLATHFGLSSDSLLLAKHQPDKHTWEEISNWVRLGLISWEATCFSCFSWGRGTVHMSTCTLLLNRKVGRGNRLRFREFGKNITKCSKEQLTIGKSTLIIHFIILLGTCGILIS